MVLILLTSFCEISRTQVGPSSTCPAVCGLIPNDDFNVIFNALPPGLVLNDNDFNAGMCEWSVFGTTPSYCAYGSQNFIGLFAAYAPLETEYVYTDHLVNMVVGKYYKVQFDYSVQRVKNVAEDGPNPSNRIGHAINVTIGNSNIATKEREPYFFPSNSTNPDHWFVGAQDCKPANQMEWSSYTSPPFQCTAEMLTYPLFIRSYTSGGNNNSEKYNASLHFIDNFCLTEYSCASYFTHSIECDRVGLMRSILTNATPNAFLWEFGDGTSSNDPSLNLSHTYAYPGTFNVCLTTFCDNVPSKICKLLKIPSGLNCPAVGPANCPILINVPAVSCPGDGAPTYLANISIPPMPGFSICPQAGNPLNINGISSVNSMSTSENGAINISLNISTTATSGTVPAKIYLCNGTQVICVDVNISLVSCNSCTTSNQTITLTCDNQVSGNGSYTYNGVMPVLSSGCTSVSTAAGYSPPSNGAGAFQIINDSNGDINGSIIMNCGGQCTTYTIVGDSCEAPNNTPCEEFWDKTIDNCKIVNGNYVYTYEGVLPIPSGYTFLGTPYIKSNVGSVVVTNVLSNGGFLYFTFTITVPPGTTDVTIPVFFLDANGNKKCLRINFTLSCERPQNRNKVSSVLNEINLRPNPAKDYIDVILETNSVQDYMLNIFNNAGQLSKTAYVNIHNSRIDLSELPEGLFIIKVVNEEQKPIVKKLTILR